MNKVRKIVKEVLNEILSKDKLDALFKSDFGDFEFIKWTRNGALYKKTSGIIIKITKDKSEYDNALRFLNKPHKNFVKYYDAKPWREINGVDYFVLEMDEVIELDDAGWDLVDLIQNSLGSQEYMLDDNRRWRFLNELKQNPEWYEEYGSYKDAVNLVLNLYSMYKEANRRGFKLYDLRAQNLGITKNGNIVHFDIGDEHG